MNHKHVRLGLRENLSQFILLVIVNAFVGAMVGMERSILPSIAESEFHLEKHSAVFSFIIIFGVAKAATNYLAGRLSDQYGRKIVLIWGWCLAIPVPFLLMYAGSWNGILFANALLGVSQGLTWSTTVIMKIDIVGSRQRGLAMGLNEFAGYLSVAVSALITGLIADRFGLRPEPFFIGVGFVFVGLLLSVFFVKESRWHVDHESNQQGASLMDGTVTQKEVFYRTTFKDRNLSSISITGLVNNLNDGMAWGLFPMVFASAGMNLKQIAIVSAVYPAVWGIGQLFTGALSDRIGRKILISAGMVVQAVGILIIAMFGSFYPYLFGAVLLGVGTAMVYPTLLAAIGDVAHPSWRASAVGVYRLWRDLGYAFGAILTGIVSDFFGVTSALVLVALLTLLSGVVTSIRMDIK